MKLVNTVRLTCALLAGGVLALFTGAANAAAVGTPSGTSIANSALASYSVGGVAQNTICSGTGNGGGTGNSTSTGGTSTSLTQCAANGGSGATAGSATTFVVDTKLALVVTVKDAADVTVTPGQNGVSSSTALSYQVTNNSNVTVGVNFSTAQDPTATANPLTSGSPGPDDFDATGSQVFVSKANATPYVAGTDTATSISQLTSGSSAIVYVVSNIPVAQVDGDVAVVALIANVANTGTAGYGNPAGTSITSDNSAAAWTYNTVQTIFFDTASATPIDGDNANDGKASAHDAYIVHTPKLTITKTATVVSDPTGDTTPHAIPGAVMKYSIVVANTGTQTATSIGLSDSIASQVTAGTIAYKTSSVTLTDPNVSAGATQTCLDAGSTFGSDNCAFNTTTNILSATIASLTAGQTATVTFSVTIQ